MTGKPTRAALLVSALAGILGASLAQAQTVQGVLDAEARRIQQAQEAQDQIDGIVSTTRARFDQYQGLLKEIDGLQVYNRLLQNQIDDQNTKLGELRESIDQVTVVERQILPLMTRMIAGLERFIDLDVPFLLDERHERVAALKALLNRSDVTTAEQFRNVVEAWQIEVNDYGSNSETYSAELEIDGTMRQVEFLKIGRVALLYLTPDGSRAGAWDQRTREWVKLDSSYNDEIRRGIETVRTGSPALFMIPVPPPEEG
jgi:chorismate mutase